MIFGNLKSNLRLSLCFNMDGLPIFTNSKHEFWPILANIYGIYFESKFIHYHYVIHLWIQSKFSEYPKIRPFVIAIWCGEGKPVFNEFLRQFVDEPKSLGSADNFKINGYRMAIRIKCFICDTPARAYLKGTQFDTKNPPRIVHDNFCRHCSSQR